ncbi:serine hydrolase domain-containing protein [Rhabdobacter roseus]|uniref:CubicO group peptidase (Beta-lactamase class C family) n=1 Tax=Rhabdobacter roseus TaxID=1655419 RepID=A0A840TS30_9BACT|nr:serine hydrolase domain-containing protein [Rhabdobacter roseus]MBB5287166.1 CubicO group peptidase (beta-lactamase class C family) [Rhabdobacter roseus]
MKPNYSSLKNLIFVALLLATCSCGSAQKLDTPAADSLFAFYDQHELFFVNALVKREGTLLYQGSAGYQNREAGIKNNPKTQFLIGSITKTYTATLIMQLVEEGQLKLDDKLARFYPALPNADRITLEMLLRHRSGLFNYTNAPTFAQEVSTPISKEQFLERFKSLKTNFVPDSRFEYSNTNYLLLGFIIEEITKDTYINQLQNRILNKLNLKDTYYGRPDDQTNFAKSYVFNGEKWLPTQPEWNTDWAAAAGGIATTASDLALFYEALFAGKLVSTQSLARMMELKEGYGFGLGTVPYGNRTFYGHGGGIETYYSYVGYNPDDKTLFVRLINGQKHLDPNDISIQILNAAYGAPLQFPSLTVKPEVEVAPGVLSRYEGTYAAPGFPLEIKVFVKDGKLYGQATGQSAFKLTSYSDTSFGFTMAKIEMNFFEKDGQQAFHFSQGPNKMDFVRKP